MLVPQAIYTFDMRPDADALGAFAVCGSLGTFGTKDFAGRPLPMSELLRANTATLSGRFARANDMSVTKLLKSGSLRFRISWPGYADWIMDIRAGPISSMAIQIAVIFKQFLTACALGQVSAHYKRGGGLQEWNIQAKRFTIEDFALASIIHVGGDVFAAEIEHISRPGPTPRGRF
ncbi:hypothetical protein C8T65DRAFT_834088 [Cerioporus squamosus]|nr:hypothetical protein C8T65DRAFT_834088 [Cerioporus squamosus]